MPRFVRILAVAALLAAGACALAQTFTTPINNASSVLAADHAIGGTTLVLRSGDGALFGSPTPSDPIRVTVVSRPTLAGGQIVPNSTRTIYLVTARTADTLSGLTPAEGTSDHAYRANDPVAILVTAGTIVDVQAAVADARALAESVEVDTAAAFEAIEAVDSSAVKITGNQTKNGVLTVTSPIVGTITGSIGQAQVTGLSASLTAKADDSSVVKLATPQTITAPKMFTDAALTLTADASTASPLDLRRVPVLDGHNIMRVWGTADPVDPSWRLRDDGSIEMGAELIQSTVYVNSGTDAFRRIGPPGPFMYGVVLDVNGAAIQAKDCDLPGTRAVEVLDKFGNYRIALRARDAAILFGETNGKDANDSPLYDTNLYRVSAGGLKTDSVFFAAGAVRTQDNFRLDGTFGNLQLGDGSKAFIQLEDAATTLYSGVGVARMRAAAIILSNPNAATEWLTIDGSVTVSSLTTLVGLTTPGTAAAKLETKGVGSGNSFAAYHSDGAEKLRVAPTGVAIGGGTVVQKILSATAALDFGSIAAGATAELTVAVTGATTGSSVDLGPPAGLEAGLIAFGRVSAADTVTVRIHNTTGGAIDPASATWRATAHVF